MVGNTPPTTQKASKNNKSKGCFFHSISLLNSSSWSFSGPAKGGPQKGHLTWVLMCAHVRPASEDGRPAACDGGQDPALDMPAQAAPWHGYTGRSLLNINIFEYIWFIYIYIHVNRYTQKINTIPFYRFQIRRRSWDDLGIFRVCVHWVWSFCRSRLSPGLFVGNAVGAGAEMVGNTPPTTQKASKNNKSKGCFFPFNSFT